MIDQGQKQENGQTNPPKRPGFLQVMTSVLAAIFGVQSARNRERDFTQGRFRDFLGVYVVIVILIVVGMILFVRLVLSQVGAG